MKKISKYHYILFGTILGILNIISGFIFNILIHFEKSIPTFVSYVFNAITVIAFILVFIGIFKKEKNEDIHSKKKKIIWLSLSLIILEVISTVILRLLNGMLWMLPFDLGAILFRMTTLLAYVILVYGIILKKTTKVEKETQSELNINKTGEVEKQQNQKINKKSLWTIILVMSIFVIMSLLMYFINNPFFIIFAAPIGIVLIILIIISAIKIKQLNTIKFSKFILRLIISGLTILTSSIIMPFTMINNYIIILLTLISLITLWLDINTKKYYFITSISSALIIFILVFNYLIIEPRISAINYLNDKYGIEKNTIEIKNINFMCSDTSVPFSSPEPCITMEVKYGEYDIYLYKSKHKKWDDSVSKGDLGVDLEMQEDYIEDNNIVIRKDLQEQLRSHIENIFKKYDIEFRKYNYEDYEDGYYYYFVKTDNADNITSISLDIKNKIKEMCENFDDSYVLDDNMYFVDITFTKKQDVYDKYEELQSERVEPNYETNVAIRIEPEYTDIMNIDKHSTIDNEDYYKINEEFINLYNTNNFENNYDFVKFNIRFSGNLENGANGMTSDAYFIKGAKIIETEEEIIWSNSSEE